MPLPILGWVAIATGTALVGYLASGDSDCGSSSGGSWESDAAVRQREQARQRERVREELQTEASQQLTQLVQAHRDVLAPLSALPRVPSVEQIRIFVAAAAGVSENGVDALRQLDPQVQPSAAWVRAQSQRRELEQEIAELQAL
ncbi:hypothetical protein, partial [Laribacter hongkongensis]